MHVPRTWSLDGYFTHIHVLSNNIYLLSPTPQIETTSRKPDLAKQKLHRLSALTDNGMLHITLKLRPFPSSCLQDLHAYCTTQLRLWLRYAHAQQQFTKVKVQKFNVTASQ